eukprot:5360315-Prymnesium_polylepis.1
MTCARLSFWPAQQCTRPTRVATRHTLESAPRCAGGGATLGGCASPHASHVSRCRCPLNARACRVRHAASFGIQQERSARPSVTAGSAVCSASPVPFVPSLSRHHRAFNIL